MKQGRVGMNIKRCDYCGVYSMKPVSITFGSRAKRLTNAASGKNFGEQNSTLRRRLLIELIEKCAEEERFDFVRDILIRYMSIKKICGYKIKTYWSNIASVEDYYRTNMDFLKKEVRDFFFREYPDIYTKVDDLPPAKYNVGSDVRNSLVASGAIINGTVEGSLLFKKVFVGSNCTIKNSIILNDVYIGDNTYIENCIVESGGTILANSYYKGEDGPKVVIEKSDRYVFQERMMNMNITDVRIRKMTKEGNMKAVASITIDNELAIHDIKIIEGEKGLFIAMPSRKTPDGDYRDIAHPISQESRDTLQKAILEAYEKVLLSQYWGYKRPGTVWCRVLTLINECRPSESELFSYKDHFDPSGHQ